ncbi:MAG: hypothetical protein AB7I41_19395 [Candidatus Sericytochromatia bacterium]
MVSILSNPQINTQFLSPERLAQIQHKAPQIAQAAQAQKNQVILTDQQGEVQSHSLEDLIHDSSLIDTQRFRSGVFTLHTQGQTFVLDLKQLDRQTLKESLLQSLQQLQQHQIEIPAGIQAQLSQSAQGIIAQMRSHSEQTPPTVQRLVSESPNETQLDRQHFQALAAKRPPLDPKQNPLMEQYWSDDEDRVGVWVRQLEAQGDLKTQGQVYEHWRAINQILQSRRRQALTPEQANEIRNHVIQAARLAGRSFQAEADSHAAMSQFYGNALVVAEYTRDAAASTVNAVADKVPALKPLAVGMNSALAFIDAYGSGESATTAGMRAAVEGVLSALPGGESMGQKVKAALGKAVARVVADMVAQYKEGQPINSATFLASLQNAMAGELTGLVGGEIDNTALRVAVETLATRLYDTFLKPEG